MNSYEIYTEKFSQIVNADNIVAAIRTFQGEHPNQEVIFTESTTHAHVEAMTARRIRNGEVEGLMGPDKKPLCGCGRSLSVKAYCVVCDHDKEFKD